jgi:hypothetical protein
VVQKRCSLLSPSESRHPGATGSAFIVLFGFPIALGASYGRGGLRIDCVQL